MELSWSTFLLEIVNFLVLVWILKRFLYRPVLDVIDRRRAGIEKTLADANARREEAGALQRRYEGRLATWEKERHEAMERLDHELQQERARALDALRQELESERTRQQVANQRRAADFRHQAEQAALDQGAAFAARLLGQAATEDLERRLVDIVVNTLAELPADRRAQLGGGIAGGADRILVASAFELPGGLQERLREVLNQALQQGLPVEFEQDPSLLAGLRITIGASVLGLNLADELEGFTRISGAGKPG